MFFFSLTVESNPQPTRWWAGTSPLRHSSARKPDFDYEKQNKKYIQGSHGHEIPGNILKLEKYFSSTGKVLELIKGPGRSWKK